MSAGPGGRSGSGSSGPARGCRCGKALCGAGGPAAPGGPGLTAALRRAATGHGNGRGRAVRLRAAPRAAPRPPRPPMRSAAGPGCGTGGRRGAGRERRFQCWRISRRFRLLAPFLPSPAGRSELRCPAFGSPCLPVGSFTREAVASSCRFCSAAEIPALLFGKISL